MTKRLVKSKNKVIAGVCGGIAEYFGMDYTIARLVYALLTIFTAFAGIPIYIILWIIMPDR
ncbi:PspC domain-containing protein [Bacteroides sp. 51]|uniref:PspC domain-containing protein n=1 Tax=Bacteroides sp. 51 TaxID=2302938 RepID=UPI0013D0CB95|nr:PspC domain-containing protein [Bacteroides sp. 51]NDV80677.1 PspC domain-containing protein [Bacteroides sp. 51]